MVEEKKAVKKAAGVKAANATVKKAPATSPAAESAVWPFPATEKTETAAAAKSAKKTTAKPAAKAAEKPAAKKPAVKKAASPKSKPVAQPSAQERYRMVETAAYYIAERSGFQGCTTDHWAAAEIEIAKKLGG